MRHADGSFSLDPGSLRHRVTVQRCTKTQDSYGQDVLTWADLLTMWAQVRAMTGNEVEAAKQTAAEARFKIRSWWPPVTIQREDRIVWGTRTLDILDAEDPTGVGREIVILAKELDVA
jgi:SPP1 family predicted phage head-tail adaptor